MLSKAIDWLFVLVAIIAASIIVSILFFDHFAFFVIEKLDGGIHRAQPGVLVNFSDRDTSLWIDLEKASQ